MLRSQQEKNGGGEIRTHGRENPTSVFKTDAINHSATPPTAYYTKFAIRAQSSLTSTILVVCDTAWRYKTFFLALDTDLLLSIQSTSNSTESLLLGV